MQWVYGAKNYLYTNFESKSNKVIYQVIERYQKISECFYLVVLYVVLYSSTEAKIDIPSHFYQDEQFLHCVKTTYSVSS